MCKASRRRKCVIYGETNNHAAVFAHVVCPNAHQGRLFVHPEQPTIEQLELWSFHNLERKLELINLMLLKFIFYKKEITRNCKKEIFYTKNDMTGWCHEAGLCFPTE